LAVLAQRSVHHHAREAELDRGLAHRRRLSVILVHHDRNAGIALDGGLDEVAQEELARVLPRAGRRLHDDGAVGLGGGSHDRLHLLEIVDVEGGQAVIVLGGVIEQLTHGNQRHGDSAAFGGCTLCRRTFAAPVVQPRFYRAGASTGVTTRSRRAAPRSTVTGAGHPMRSAVRSRCTSSMPATVEPHKATTRSPLTIPAWAAGPSPSHDSTRTARLCSSAKWRAMRRGRGTLAPAMPR